MKQKTFLFAALAAAFLSVANYAAAQVTIGGSDLPKAGTILDLNSTTKGGLALSNVSLTDLNTIPVGFPGINNSGDVTPEVKAKLTGAIVYNINSDICLGVYVWDGNCWRKIDKDYQAKAAGAVTLDIKSPDIDAILGGEAVTFEVINPGDAQFYYWYLNDVLLDTTETKILVTTAISSGDNQEMKVVLDNCLSLSESSSITFNARNIYPNSLPAASGGWIRIFSADAFPYASTDEYIQDGLVAHYDGINNQNINDKMHSSDVVEWKDISGNGYDVKLRKGHSTQTREEAIPVTNITQCSGARWDSNGFFFKDYCYFAKVPADPDATDALYNIMPNLPYGNDNYTIESVFDPTSREALNGGIVGWGEQTDYQACSVRFHNMSDNAKPKFRNSWWGSDVSAEFTDPGSTNIKNVAVTYDNDALAFPYHRIFYYNGTTNSIAYIDPNCPSGGTTHICREKTNKNTSKRGSFFVGQSVGVNTNDNAPDGVSVYTDNMNRYSNGNKLFSVRVYNRALTPIQIENNYNVDKLRFEAPPIVRVDGKQCTNVTVLSPRVITCQVPPGTAGIVDIEVRTADDASQILWLDDEFTYQ